MSNSNERTYALFSGSANNKIIAALEKENAKIFQFPPLETEKSVADLKSLDTFDWIIFPDVLTVDYFLQLLEENEIDPFEMDLLRVCAFGEAVADRLRFGQIHSDVVPASLDAANVFLALSEYAGKSELRDLKFLLPGEISSEYKIRRQLTASGATTTDLPVYQAKRAKTEEITKLKVLLGGGAIDEFIFSSPTDLIALRIYFNDALISKTLAEIHISAVDKIMFQNLRENGLPCEYFRLK